MSYGAIYPYTWWGSPIKDGWGGVYYDFAYSYLLNKYGGAAAAYSLRQLSADATNVVRVRRDSDNEERDFKATEVSDGTLQSWVNGELDALPLDTATAAAAYSLRNLKTSYSGSVVRVRRSSDNAEADFTAAEVADGTLENWVNTEYQLFSEDFSSSTGWTLDASATISGGTLNFTSSTITLAAYKGIGAVPFQRVIVTYTISDYSAGDVAFVNYGGGVTGTFRSANGTYVEEITLGSGNQNWGFWTRSGFTGKVDNFSVQVLTADGRVTTWYDQAGSNNATQGTASSQPKIVDAGSLVTENGKAAVSFDGVDDFMDFTPTQSITKSVFFAGSVVSNTTARQRIFEELRYNGATNNAGYIINQNGFDANNPLVLQIYNNGLTEVSYNNPTLGRILIGAIITAGNQELYLNSNQVATGTATMKSDFTVGKLSFSTSPTNGKYQEIVIYNTDQSTNRTKIENNISTYYDIYDTSANGYVATWYDQSVNGNDATQATASAQPQIVSNGVIITDNGKASLKPVDGTTRLDISYTGSDDFYSFAIGKVPLSNTGLLYTGDRNSEYILVSTQGGTASAFSSNAGTLVYYKNGNVITLTNTGDVYDEFVNQSLITIEADTSTWNALEFGYSYDGNVGIYNLQEVVIYHSDQTDNKADIENEINNYYTIYAGSPISGLLYDYPSSAAAYSVRQLTIYDNDYKETLVKVRRSSDNAEVDVKADTNYEISLNSFTSAQMSLGDWIGSDDGYVVTWYDQSGNDNDATQSTASSQPQLISGGVVNLENGKTTLDFDGVDDSLITTSNIGISGASERTFVNVATPNINDSTSAFFEFAQVGGGGTLFDFTSEYAVRVIGGNKIWAVSSTTQTLLTLILPTGGSNTDDLLLYENESILSSTEINTQNILTTDSTLKIGGLLRPYNGFYQELIVYISDQSTNRTGIETNINNYFNIYP